MPKPQDDEFSARLEMIAAQKQSMLNEADETINEQRAKFETLKTECEERNAAVKGFTSKITDFISDTKTTLLQIVDELYQNESLWAQSLGPVLPACQVSREMLCDQLNQFTKGFLKLVTKVTENW